MIPQIERVAHKYAYNKLSTEVFNTMINTLGEVSDNPTGNKIGIVCNEAFWQESNLMLGKFLSDNHVDGTHLWSKAANDYIKVGAAYNTYRFAGNECTFMVDRALSREYGNKGYAIAIDLSSDLVSGMPAVSMMTLKGGNCIQNYITGVKHTACAA